MIACFTFVKYFWCYVKLVFHKPIDLIEWLITWCFFSPVSQHSPPSDTASNPCKESRGLSLNLRIMPFCLCGDLLRVPSMEDCWAIACPMLLRATHHAQRHVSSQNVLRHFALIPASPEFILSKDNIAHGGMMASQDSKRNAWKVGFLHRTICHSIHIQDPERPYMPCFVEILDSQEEAFSNHEFWYMTCQFHRKLLGYPWLNVEL